MCVLALKRQRARQQNYTEVHATGSFQGKWICSITCYEGKRYGQAHTNPLTLSLQNRALKTPHQGQISSLLIQYDFIQGGICTIHSKNMRLVPTQIGNSPQDCRGDVLPTCYGTYFRVQTLSPTRTGAITPHPFWQQRILHMSGIQKMLLPDFQGLQNSVVEIRHI